jgi:Rieske Fe-S protein
MTDFALTRRGLAGGAVVAVVGGVAGYFVAAGSAAARSTRGPTVANAAAPPSGAGGQRLVALASVPVGGGVVLGQQAVVVTRGADGVHAFSAVCTHQGCHVDRVQGGTIDCPCHGSRFDVTTGAVVAGPAPRPLPRIAVVVRDGQVVRS